MSEFFDNFHWHSAIGIDIGLSGDRKFCTRLAYSDKVAMDFEAVSGKMLIHKTTKALWRLSDDKSSIEPVFDSDVLGSEEVKEIES